MSHSQTITKTPGVLSVEAYAEQLAFLARCIATGDVDKLQQSVDGPEQFEHLVWFAEGNFAKRMDWLQRTLEFLAPAFEDLDDLLQQFVMAVPAAAVGVGTDDAKQFLKWLPQTVALTPVQQDYVTCQTARMQVESLANANRIGNLRFQELASLAADFADELAHDPTAADRLAIHLNPTHLWVQFQTGELLDESTDGPTDIVFFSQGEDVNTGILSPDACELVHELDELGPMTLNAWLSINGSVTREELVELCVTLAGMGLMAFA